jgi:hypothetical protein
VFNRKLPANPTIAWNSAQVISRMLTVGDLPSNPQPGNWEAPEAATGGWPTYYSSASDPSYTVTCDDPYQGCGLSGSVHVHIPNGAIPQGGCWASAGSDRHLTIIDQSTTPYVEYDFWRTGGMNQPLGSACPIQGGGTIKAAIANKTPLLPNGQGPSITPGYLAGATAAGVGNLAGRIRLEELELGTIEHAISIVVPCNGYFWDSRRNQSTLSVYPSILHNGLRCDDQSIKKNMWNAPVMGMHLRLNMTKTAINNLHLPAWKQTILYAMVDYGLIVNDTGTSNYFDMQTEGDLQYTAVDHDFGPKNAPWYNWAGNQGWSTYDPDHARLGSWRNDADMGNWTNVVWKNLQVVDECVDLGTCGTQTNFCTPGVQICGPCPTVGGHASCVMSCNAQGTAYTQYAQCSNYCTTDGTYSWCQ